MARLVPGRYTTAIALFVVIVFAIVTLTAIRYFGHSPAALTRFPPYLAQCPPYWTSEGNGKCTYNASQPNGKPTCTANDLKKVNLGVLEYESGNPTVDFSNNSLPDRCNWAKTCQVFWEGVSDHNCSDSNHFNNYTLY
jgi:hypothetical protein